MNEQMATAAAFLTYGPLAFAKRVRHTDPKKRRRILFDIGRAKGTGSLVVILGIGRTFEAALKQAKESPLGREIEAALVKYEEKLRKKHKEKDNGGTEQGDDHRESGSGPGGEVHERREGSGELPAGDQRVVEGQGG